MTRGCTLGAMLLCAAQLLALPALLTLLAALPLATHALSSSVGADEVARGVVSSRARLQGLHAHLHARHAGAGNCTPSELSLLQPLDHFGGQGGARVRQRVFVNEDNRAAGDENAPIFLYAGGEWVLEAQSACGGFIGQLAAKHGATVAAVEHRFYGESLPEGRAAAAGALSTGELRHLHVQQAVADLVAAADAVASLRPPSGSAAPGPRRSLVTRADTAAKRPVILFGGSYAGVLVALARQAASSAFAGAVASSAPLETTDDFFQYEAIGLEAAARVAPADCDMASYAAAWAALERSLATAAGRRLAGDALGTCSPLETGSSDEGALSLGALLYSVPEVGGIMQYWPRSNSSQQLQQFCGAWTNSSVASGDGTASMTAAQLRRLGRFWRAMGLNVTNATDTIGGAEESSCLFSNFSALATQAAFTNETVVPTIMAYRAWWWQKCSWGGYFRTCETSRCGHAVDMQRRFNRALCGASFNATVYPDTAFWRAYAGGSKTYAGSNVFFANGGFDGWHALSVPRPPTHSVEVDMNATASHCADMAGDAGSAVVNAKQAAVVARWLTESYAGAGLRRAGLAASGAASSAR